MNQSDYDYMRYVSKHNKHYETVEEFEMRKALFIEIETFIRMANARSTTYRAGHNKFSDWTQEEKDKLLGLKTYHCQRYPLMSFPNQLMLTACPSLLTGERKAR